MQELDLKGEGRQKITVLLAIILPVLLLAGLGIVTLISAGAVKADPMAFVQKQFVWLGIALVGGIFAATIKLDILRKLAIPIAAGSILLLIAVIIPSIGKEVNGARRWIEIGSFVFQPSDIAKVSIVIVMAAYLHAKQRYIETFTWGAIAPFGIIGVFCALMALEPDYGTAALCGGIAIVMMYLAGTRFLHLIFVGLIGAAGLLAVVLTNPNRVARILSFMDREANMQGGAFQLTQAMYAFGAGGLTGSGLGQGRQQYAFIPEAHTDFIFANIGEELGMIGTFGVLGLFVFLFVFFSFHLRKAPNMFEFALGLGSILMIVLQAIFNMGVVTGIFPTKGISLPFISYGGSNLVVMFFFTGILVNCARRWNSPKRITTTVYE